MVKNKRLKPGIYKAKVISVKKKYNLLNIKLKIIGNRKKDIYIIDHYDLCD